MKELSIEQKAKAYDEALEKSKRLYEQGTITESLAYIFPELKESKDDMVRKAIIEHFEGSHSSMYPYKGFTKEQILAWLEKQGQTFTKKDVDDAYLKGVCDAKQELEKQGEQKPADVRTIGYWHVEDVEQNHTWSKEDEEMLKMVIKSCEQCGSEYAYYWLKSLKDRVQPKQEWSEEDEKNLNEVQRILELHGQCSMGLILWLKSLRHQNTWKPSDEQIKVCKEVYADILSAKGFDLGTVNGELNRLEEELKKLKKLKL